jgi:hypothetical protein
VGRRTVAAGSRELAASPDDSKAQWLDPPNSFMPEFG